MKITSKSTSKKAWLTLGSIVIVALVATVTALELTNTTHLFGTPTEDVVTTAGDASSIDQPKENISGDKDFPKKTPQPTDGNRIGTGTDTSGQTTPETEKSQWVTSESGVLTVKQPTANAIIANGDNLVGASKSDFVHFRLIGNEQGVIARGELKVVDGKFSATLNFNAHGNRGRLDVFTKTADGVEQNEVQIVVGLQ